MHNEKIYNVFSFAVPYGINCERKRFILYIIYSAIFHCEASKCVMKYREKDIIKKSMKVQILVLV